jgi:hypothetical protein
MSFTLQGISDKYENTKSFHDNLMMAFTHEVKNREYLLSHKQYAEHSIYGDMGFHYLWNLLVSEAPNRFKFLEIGVFKGQVTSLIGLLADYYYKDSIVVGISPFDGTGDKYSQYQQNDKYFQETIDRFNRFTSKNQNLHLIKGLSQDKDVIKRANLYGSYDIIYIDGSHDYENVVSDIDNYSPLLTIGGYLVMDDAATDREMTAWNGHAEVGQAVRDKLGSNPNFVHCFAIGHIRLFKRVK